MITTKRKGLNLIFLIFALTIIYPRAEKLVLIQIQKYKKNAEANEISRQEWLQACTSQNISNQDRFRQEGYPINSSIIELPRSVVDESSCRKWSGSLSDWLNQRPRVRVLRPMTMRRIEVPDSE